MFVCGGTVLGLVLLLYAASELIILRAFEELESQFAHRNVERARRAFAVDVAALDRTVFDWAAWDDTYQFIVDANEQFTNSNLVDAAFGLTALRINVMLFADPSGTIVYGKGYDYHADAVRDVPEGLTAHISNPGLLNLPDESSKIDGILLLPGGPMMVAARPLLTSNEEGPIRGGLVMGRYFDDYELKRLSESVQLSLAMFQKNDPALPQDIVSALPDLAKKGSIVTRPLGEESIAGYTILPDIYGQPCLIMKAEMPRSIFSEGRRFVGYYISFLLIAGLVFTLGMVLLLETSILSRLSQLSSRVAGIRSSDRSAHRLDEGGNDELSQLGQEINKMLDQLAQTEREMVRVERLRALGEMAAGVSHNLNNILVGILGPAEILDRECTDPKMKEEVALLTAAAQRATDLVHRLNRAVLHEPTDITYPVSAQEAVRLAVESTRPRWKDEAEAKGLCIRIVTEQEEVPPLRGTQGGLHDLLINLVFNAVDAMPRGGTITIGVRSADDFVELSVADTGVGMPEETRRRVFEPFFTTKTDVGTGLGLATVLSTISSWGGMIEVDSEPGKGSSFTIRIPVWPEAAQPPAQPKDQTVPQASGNILIVEDDDVVARILYRFLPDTCTGHISSNGPQAFDVFTPGLFDVVLVDLGLPGMSGDEIARQMRQSDPALVTILTSGWQLSDNDPRIEVFDFVLQKPFTRAQVRAIIARGMELRHTRQVDQA